MVAVKIILKILIALGCVALVAFVLLQPSKDGMSAALTGMTDNGMPSAQRKSRPEMRYAFYTKILAAVVGVLSLVAVFLDKF